MQSRPQSATAQSPPAHKLTARNPHTLSLPSLILSKNNATKSFPGFHDRLPNTAPNQPCRQPSHGDPHHAGHPGPQSTRTRPPPSSAGRGSRHPTEEPGKHPSSPRASATPPPGAPPAANPLCSVRTTCAVCEPPAPCPDHLRRVRTIYAMSESVANIRLGVTYRISRAMSRASFRPYWPERTRSAKTAASCFRTSTALA